MVQQTEHAVVGVEDLSEAVEFYTDVMGFVEVAERDDTVYLGCGLDGYYDIGLTEGDTGVEHFAVRTGEERFERLRDRLSDRGVPFERTGGEEPGQEKGLRLSLPSDVEMEFVVLGRERYPHVSDTAHPDRASIAPHDFDHINLASTVVREDVEFVRDVLGGDVTEVQRDADTGEWELVFTRFGDLHHDVAFFAVADPAWTLHHVSFTMESLDHLKSFVDHLVRHDLELEVGVSRHRAGNNLFAYFWSPGGNRVEISTEMSTLPPETGTVYRDETFTFTSWGGITIPDSFSRGT